jgi:hypothetical protein
MSAEPITRAELLVASATNLKFLESWSDGHPELQESGVDLVKVFTYDLIQLCNTAYLAERLAQ